MTTTITTISPETGSTVQLVTIEGGIGFFLSADMLAKLGVEAGDTLHVRSTPTGIQITPGTLAVARRIMQEDKDLLRRLAE